jgi:hypothetical protein
MAEYIKAANLIKLIKRRIDYQSKYSLTERIEAYEDVLDMIRYSSPTNVAEVTRCKDCWMAEDFDLWIRIALAYKVFFWDEPLAYYNQEVQLKWRALGKLYPPLRQFAFDADYLIPYQENDRDIKHVVDMVKIVCLKKYYLSREYHQLALKELEKIDYNEYRNKSFASYLWQPLWKLRLLAKLFDIYKILRNK